MPKKSMPTQNLVDEYPKHIWIFLFIKDTTWKQHEGYTIELSLICNRDNKESK